MLYLDPDILILDPIPAAGSPLKRNLFAAAIHSGLAQISAPVNRVRLHSDDDAGYFNSGVLVMDLAAQRRELNPAEIFAWTREHANELILPDQDPLDMAPGFFRSMTPSTTTMPASMMPIVCSVPGKRIWTG